MRNFCLFLSFLPSLAMASELPYGALNCHELVLTLRSGSAGGVPFFFSEKLEQASSGKGDSPLRDVERLEALQNQVARALESAQLRKSQLELELGDSELLRSEDTRSSWNPFAWLSENPAVTKRNDQSRAVQARAIYLERVLTLVSGLEKLAAQQSSRLARNGNERFLNDIDDVVNAWFETEVLSQLEVSVAGNEPSGSDRLVQVDSLEAPSPETLAQLDALELALSAQLRFLSEAELDRNHDDNPQYLTFLRAAARQKLVEVTAWAKRTLLLEWSVETAKQAISLMLQSDRSHNLQLNLLAELWTELKNVGVRADFPHSTLLALWTTAEMEAQKPSGAKPRTVAQRFQSLALALNQSAVSYSTLDIAAITYTAFDNDMSPQTMITHLSELQTALGLGRSEKGKADDTGTAMALLIQEVPGRGIPAVSSAWRAVATQKIFPDQPTAMAAASRLVMARLTTPSDIKRQMEGLQTALAEGQWQGITPWQQVDLLKIAAEQQVHPEVVLKIFSDVQRVKGHQGTPFARAVTLFSLAHAFSGNSYPDESVLRRAIGFPYLQTLDGGNPSAFRNQNRMGK